MIETRAREAAHRARLDVALVDVPDAETVINRRTSLRRARAARRSAAVLLVLIVGSGVGVVAARRDTSSRLDISRPSPTPTSTPARPGLSFESFHTTSCDSKNGGYALDGCVLVHDQGTSADVVTASPRDGGANGWVIDVTLTANSAPRFANQSIFNATIDGATVNASASDAGRLTLSGVGATPWDATTAQALAERVLRG